jgi:exonuclease SbcD
MAHMTIQGAKLARSEVDYYTKDIYEISGQILPSEAQYIALGHIHTPQQIPNAAPTYYSGSLIQIDFGEAGEEKGFNLVEIEPSRPAKVEFKSIPAQKPLKVLRCTEANLEETLEEHREHPGFLKVIVELDLPQIGLAERVRKVCKQALVVEPKYPQPEPERHIEFQKRERFDAVEEFRRYYLQHQGIEVPPAILETFKQLHQETNDAIA